MAFKKWKVTYTNPAAGEGEQVTHLCGPQQDEDAVKKHVEDHMLARDAAGQVHKSVFVSAEAE